MNKLYEEIAIQHFWKRPGLNMLEKIESSVSQRIVLGRFSDFQDLLNSYKKNSGELNKLSSLIEQNRNLFPEKHLIQALEYLPNTPDLRPQISKAFELSALVALGDNQKTSEQMAQYFSEGMYIDEVRNIVAHTVIESGFPSAMNAFLSMRNALAVSPAEDRDQQDWPEQSPMMNEIYGTKVASDVYNRLQVLDPFFNWACQDIAYSNIWSRKGLSTREKSLVTVTILIAQGKEEQTQIHMNGYLNSDGSVENLRSSLLSASKILGQASLQRAYDNLDKVVEDRGLNKSVLFSMNQKPQEELSERDQHIIKVSTLLALGKQDELTELLKEVLNTKLSKEELRSLFIHAIVYAGFPAAQDGMRALEGAM